MAFLSLLTVLFLLNPSLTAADRYHCFSSRNSSSNGADVINRNTLLYGIPAHAMDQGGFYYSHTGSTSDISATQGASAEYCLGLCRKDISASSACDVCMTTSIFDITSNCPYQRDVIGWGNDAGCVIRCVPHEFPRMFETEPVEHICNDSTVMQVHLSLFERAVSNLTTSIAKIAAGDESNSSEPHMHHYYATGEVKLGGKITIYGVGFCLPTLAPRSCNACLRAAGNISERLCYGRQGARVFTPSCVLRYELYSFYESSLTVAPKNASIPLLVTKGARSSRTRMVATVVPVMAVLAVIILTSCTTVVLKKRKQKGQYQFGASTTEACLEFSLHSIKVATNDFSASNKLGQGGFGAVYKGKLRNGQKIAVKRLAVHSLRGEVEFKNEVRLLAKLDHKNLIRLIGFCIEQKERLLIYELALNGSLDRYLFDSVKREHLTWEVRYNIIEGITHGMIHLHEECDMRILHRDLKASNILLDEMMNPKISDFGTARLYVEDQGTASKIVGTYGYMSPEYVKHGKISIKMDVFSFGVLLLEIVCGKRNNASKNPKHIDHLLSKAWKNWKTGNLVKLIDPILLMSSCSTDEIIRCIRIGLLCVQEIAACRPTMKSVIQMLKDCSQSLPPPLKPAYFMNIGDDESYVSTMDQNNLLDSKPHSSWSTYHDFSSINEFTITQPYPDAR